MSGRQTPSQTIGPFFSVMLPLAGAELVPRDEPGALRILGSVVDGAGAPVTDALIEIWQADPAGLYHAPETWHEGAFRSFGRCASDGEGIFSFITLKPGTVAGTDELVQAPHINVSFFARGLLRRLTTRIYFPDEQHANERDPVLNLIADPERRRTLIARPDGDGCLRFDIRLQGEGETVFFDR
jgi:protocatechuate 3,4-dioxygenase alpha subunit